MTDLDASFLHPEELPINDEMAKQWQTENKNFWEENSMRYDWRKTIPFPEFSEEYFEEIDKRFLDAVRPIMPWRKVPFEQWLHPTELVNMDVLEIGVGNGTHAQIIAGIAKSYSGIDITAYAAKSTSKRLELIGSPGTIRQMDAENLDFPDQSFDLVWSWGVIHHSSNTNRILDEIHRVLKPDGKSTIMVYYRSWYSYTLGGIFIGVFKGYFLRGMTLHQINQSRTDGALARYYTFSSWRKTVSNRFHVKRIETLGNKGDLLLLPGGRLKDGLLKLIPTWMTILFLKNFRMGSFLICEMKKK